MPEWEKLSESEYKTDEFKQYVNGEQSRKPN